MQASRAEAVSAVEAFCHRQFTEPYPAEVERSVMDVQQRGGRISPYAAALLGPHVAGLDNLVDGTTRIEETP